MIIGGRPIPRNEQKSRHAQFSDTAAKVMLFLSKARFCLILLFCNALQRSADIAMDDHAQPFHQQGRIAAHILLDPIQHQPDKRVFIKMRDKLLIRLGHVQTLRLLAHHR